MKNSYGRTTCLLSWAVIFILLSQSVNAQLAKDKCKFLGNIIAGSLPSDFTTFWNQITPENAGKWGSIEGARDEMQWGELDLAYNGAKNNDFPFKQHTFVWGQQQPDWIGTLAQPEQKAEVEEWIKSYCEKYPETDFIDVVNEPLHAVPGYAASLGGAGTTGWDWVIWSFEKARQYCPNAKLALNDYNIISNDASTNTYITIINLLKSRNLIDIIGEQGHFLETTPLATAKKNLDKLHEIGLPIHISEFDINLADDTQQRNKCQELFPVLWTHPGVQGITLWGYRQNAIWRENAYLVRSNGSKRPALDWLINYVAGSPNASSCDEPITATDEEESGMNVYPNPSADGRFTLELGHGRFEIRIMDLFGDVKMKLSTTGNQQVTVQCDEPPGVYILHVNDGDRTTLKKIIIK